MRPDSIAKHLQLLWVPILDSIPARASNLNPSRQCWGFLSTMIRAAKHGWHSALRNQWGRALLSGLVWGVIADGIVSAVMPDGFRHWPTTPLSIRRIFLAAPIGVAVYAISRWMYRGGYGWKALVPWSVFTLYVASGFWGMEGEGFRRLFYGPLEYNQSSTLEDLLMSGFTVGWMLTTRILVFWPLFILAAANHYWLARNERPFS